MEGIELPPLTEDFTADPVELFFDLAYVFAFSQLVALLIADPTWAGVGKAALLFGLLWLPWQQLTWAANAILGNGRAVRDAVPGRHGCEHSDGGVDFDRIRGRRTDLCTGADQDHVHRVLNADLGDCREHQLSPGDLWVDHSQHRCDRGAGGGFVL